MRVITCVLFLGVFIVGCESKKELGRQRTASPADLPEWREGDVARIVISQKILGRVNRRVLGKNVLGHVYDPRYGGSRGLQYSMQGAGLWDPKTRQPVREVMTFLRETGTRTMRWPGGCGAHRFNWKKTVGPLAKRPHQHYGLPEFLQCCRAVGADPIITLAVYWGSARDAADLVEYLNAPVGKNPNGGRDWAAVRAGDGHPEPYNVVWFEYGNESYHGPHGPSGKDRGSAIDAQEYSRRYRDYGRAMKAVDPGIKLGAIMINEHTPRVEQWSRDVIRLTAGVADFYIHHTYLPQYRRNDGVPPADQLFTSAFAAARQAGMLYAAANRYIAGRTRRRIPLAITEYNCAFVQNKPVPYRLSLGAAISVADMIREMLNPRYNIDNAQYWQFSNEYWGMIKGYGKPYRKRPAYYMFKLYHDYLGEHLVQSRIFCGGFETIGGYGVLPANGVPRTGKPLGGRMKIVDKWVCDKVKGLRVTGRNDANGLRVEIAATTPFNLYQPHIEIAAKPSTAYMVRAQVRTSGLKKKGAGVAVGDARGWDMTRSQSMSNTTAGTEWRSVECLYHTLPDTSRIQIMARRLTAAEAGTVWIRNLTIQEYQPVNQGRVPYIATVVTRDKAGNISLVIINRNMHRAEPVRIMGIACSQATARTLTGPRVDATNEKIEDNCVIRPLPVKVGNGVASLTLPPHSLTGVGLRR